MTDANNNRSRLIFVGVLLAAAAIALIVVLVNGGSDKKSSVASTAGCKSVAAPAPRSPPVHLKRPPLTAPAAGTTATVQTSCGLFTIAFDPKAPKTAASFIYMAKQGVYDNTAINRIATNFVIQGGDPTESQAGNAGYTVDEAPPQNTVYAKGVVAMAKSQNEPPGRSGSQFFVVTAPADAGLPPDYALLGKVQSGYDVVQRIAAIGPQTGPDGPPKQPVVIEKVTINP